MRTPAGPSRPAGPAGRRAGGGAVTGDRDAGGERAAAVEVHAERDAYVAHQMQVHRHYPQPERVVPRQLPAPAAHFAGRAAELETLTGLLDQAAGTGGTVVISAIG